jgi:hypothetical protein
MTKEYTGDNNYSPENNEAYRLGWDSYLSGIALADNPYTKSSEQYNDWINGFEACIDNVFDPLQKEAIANLVIALEKCDNVGLKIVAQNKHLLALRSNVATNETDQIFSYKEVKSSAFLGAYSDEPKPTDSR